MCRHSDPLVSRIGLDYVLFRASVRVASAAAAAHPQQVFCLLARQVCNAACCTLGTATDEVSRRGIPRLWFGSAAPVLLPLSPCIAILLGVCNARAVWGKCQVGAADMAAWGWVPPGTKVKTVLQ